MLCNKLLQQIQNHIVQTSGQDKATKVLDQIKSLIELNPSGNLAQSLLSLAKQQSSGNTNAVNQAAEQIARLVASGSDYIGQPLNQTGASQVSQPTLQTPSTMPTTSTITATTNSYSTQ